MNINDITNEGKTGPGLWANINAKRERIKNGSDERMRKPGSKGAPTAKNFKDAASEGVMEVSNATLNSYIDKATSDYGHANFAARASKSHAGLEKYSQDQEARAKKRAAGLNRALSDKRRGVAEDFNGEYDDESGMAETNLHTIARAAQGLLDTIDKNENLPEWVQEKIAKVEGMLVTAWDYLRSQEEQGIDPRVGAEYSINEVSPPTITRAFNQRIKNTDDAEAKFQKSGQLADRLAWKKAQAKQDRMMDARYKRMPKPTPEEEDEYIDWLTGDLSNNMMASTVGKDSAEYKDKAHGNPRDPAYIKRLKAAGWQESIEESILEETYHDDDEFYEAYGVMEYSDGVLNEAEYHGRKVTLNKPMQGDVKNSRSTLRMQRVMSSKSTSVTRTQELKSLTLPVVRVSEHDTTARIQGQKPQLVIGLAENGNRIITKEK